MSAAPNFQPSSVLYSSMFPYHPHFWMNFNGAQEFRGGDPTMASQHYLLSSSRNNDALVVYDPRETQNVSSCWGRLTGLSGPEKSGFATAPSRPLGSPVPSEYQLLRIADTNLLNRCTDTVICAQSNQATPVDQQKQQQVPFDKQEEIMMPKPLHRIPTTRQQHYHQRHHAQSKNSSTNNVKNKTRFSATGLSSKYAVVRDTKMSLSSAPSSPGAGSLGGSLGNCYHFVPPPQITTSSSFYVPQYKGSSSSSSGYSTSGMKISSSSMSSYSSRSSMSSTPSSSGISPRKRRADDVSSNSGHGNNREFFCRKYGQPPSESDVTSLPCSCETCATDEVTARVDDVTLFDEFGQKHKRSKNDDDVVFVSAQPGPGVRPKGRPHRKSKKSTKKSIFRGGDAADQEASTSCSKFPFKVPQSCQTSQVKDVTGRYYLRSTAKGKKQDDVSCMGVSTSQQSVTSHTTQSPTDSLTSSNSETDRNCNLSIVALNDRSGPSPPRYHTRSRQKKVNAEQQQKTKSQQDSNPAHSPAELKNRQDTTSTAQKPTNHYQTASVIRTATSSPISKQQQPFVQTQNDSRSTEAVKESLKSSSSFKKLYDIHGMIGVGGGGTVHAGTRKSDGIQVAIKQVPKAKVKRWGKLNGCTVPIEFELLYKASRSGHSGVIRMLDWYERRSTYILVMERPQPVIDLFDYLNQSGALPEATARSIFRQIAQAVLHCHANGVVHRDIKDENVLLNLYTSEAKLIDFGCGTVLKNAPYTEFAGTPEFYPPEWFTHRRYYGQRVDAWSLGVLLYTMVEAEVPFQKEKDIVECDLRHKRGAHLSGSCKNLIAWMLQKDQDMRPTIEQALQHPWFREPDAPLRTVPMQKPVKSSQSGTKEVYEIDSDQSFQREKSSSGHKIASADSPDSPVSGNTSPQYHHGHFHEAQTSCQTISNSGGSVYQTACVAR